MAGRLRRTVTAVTLVALLLPLAAATSLADTGPAQQRSSSSRATATRPSADEGQCSDPVDDIVTCTFTTSSSSPGTEENKEQAQSTGRRCATAPAPMSSTTDRRDPELDPGERLHPDLGDGTVIERDLSSATIAPTTITLEAFSCDAIECDPTGDTRDVTVEGTFTATSAATRSSTRSVFDDGICTFRDSSRGTSRMRCSRAPSMANRWSWAIPTGFGDHARHLQLQLEVRDRSLTGRNGTGPRRGEGR